MDGSVVPGAVCGLLGVGAVVISVLHVVLHMGGHVLLLVAPFGSCVWSVPQVSPMPLVRLAVGCLVLRISCGVVPVPYLAYAKYPRQSLKVFLMVVPGTVFGLLGVGPMVIGVQPCLMIRCFSRASLLNVSSHSYVFGGLPATCLLLWP